MFKFKCVCCDEWHNGVPSFGFLAPAHIDGVPPEEREARCLIESDACVLDRKYFFIRGCLEIPVSGWDEPFVYGVWVSLSEASFDQFCDTFEVAARSHIGPFFGWLTNRLPLYPDTLALKTRVHLRNDGIRPRIELEPTDHPLAIEQRNGIDSDRVAEIWAFYEHQKPERQPRVSGATEEL